MSESKMKMLRKLVGGNDVIEYQPEKNQRYNILKKNWRKFNDKKKRQLTLEVSSIEKAVRLKRI